MRTSTQDDGGGVLIEWSEGAAGTKPTGLISLESGHVVFPGRSSVVSAHDIAEAYRQGGVQLAVQRSGDLTFGLRDNASGNGVCVRDRCGVQPLYYVLKPRKFFAFASSIEPLLALPGIGRRLNRLKAALYLNGPRVDGFDASLTFFEGIFRLPPSHYLVATSDRVTVSPYRTYECLAEYSHTDSAGLSEELLRRLLRAVEKRISGSGLLLSGGLKSAAIAALASTSVPNGRKLDCWSFVPTDAAGWQWPDDPRPAIKSLTDHLPLRIHPVGWADSQPIAESDCYPELRQQPRWFYIREDEAVAMAQARQAGLSAVLTGIGGQWLPIFRRPIAVSCSVLRSGRWRSLWFDAQYNRRRRLRDSVRLLRYDVLKPTLPPVFRSWLGPGYVGRASFPTQAGRQRVVKESFMAESGALDWISEHAQSIRSDFRRNAHWEMTHGSLQLHLENWALLGRHHGLEFRYPFLDPDVVDFCFQLPASYYLEGDPQRVMREALHGLVPESIRLREWRAPHVLDWPYRKLQLHGLQSRRLDELERHPLLSTMVDLAPVRAALARFPSEQEVQRAIASGGNNAAVELVTPGGVPATVAHLWSFAQFLDRNGFS